MKTIRNCKINRICYKLYSKYRKNVISLVTAAVLLFTSMPLSEASSVVAKMVSKLSNAITAMAEDSGASAATTKVESQIINGQYTINSTEDLQMLFKADPSVYKKVTILFAKTDGDFNASDFNGITKGLGNKSDPFSGKFEATDGSSVDLPIDFALFDYLDDSAELCDITLKRPNDKQNTALLAEHVTHSDATTSAKGWKITKYKTNDDDGKPVNYSFTSVIGEMAEDSIVGLTINCGEDTVVANASGNAGLACGTMGKGAQLTVNTTASGFSVTAASGNAGSLVGEMGSGAKLIIDKAYSFTGEVTGKNAGGMVGSSTDGEVSISDGGSVSIKGTFATNSTVTSGDKTGGVGGVYGEYNNNNDHSFDFDKYTLEAKFDNSSIATNFHVGGAFGKINNYSGKIDINDSTNSDDKKINVNLTSKNTLNVGGVIGAYYPQNKENTELFIHDIKTNLEIETNCNRIAILGGLIGNATNDYNYNAYINVKDVEVTLTQQKATCSGGLFGAVKSAFVDIGGSVKVNSSSVTHQKGIPSVSASGSLIGICETKNNNAGVVRLYGSTDISRYKVTNYPSKERTCNQLIGNRGDFLVYAVDWTLKRNSKITYDVDDMDWGEVLRLDGTNLTESTDETQSKDTDVLYFDENAHTVTIKGFADKTNVVISNKADFARAALIMQQSSNIFVKYSTSVDRNAMLSATINIKENINLSGTGITGFMRDNGAGYAFSGTLNGDSKTITLAVGEAYGDNQSNSKSNGQIVKHTYNGLFAKTKGAKINNLTVQGDLKVLGADGTNTGETDYDKICKIGGVVAQSEGTLSLNNVTSEITWSTNKNNTIYAGGIVGYVSNDANNVSFYTCIAKPVFDYTGTDESVCVGGVIGAVGYASAERKISFNNVSVSGTIKQSNKSVTNARVGGLIAEIRAEDAASGTYNNVAITDVKINALTIETKATSTSGGFFGHNWYRTNVTLDSATVSNSTLKTACTEFGGLVTATTGYWKIGTISLDSNNIEGSNATYFGLLIDSTFGRDADPYSSLKNYNCTLDGSYIEFIKAGGYKVTECTITLPNKLERYDEIVAFSTNDNGAGSNGQSVVSIPAVNGDLRTVIMDGKSCNTYQNQTKKDVNTDWTPNISTRYYYNMDTIRSNTSKTDTDDLMLWSVYTYAAGNIKQYFADGSNFSFDGAKNYDLKGYSYYPIDVTGAYVGGTFTFYNKEIETAEALTNGDTLIRNTTGSDGSHTQHYMMHHGLFRNVTNLTVSAKLDLNGSIGKTDNGSGALVCGKVSDGGNSKNKLSVTGSIVLDKIYVNTDIKTDNYAPLLINKIGNMTDITISNISESADRSNYDMANQPYAATSLIGDVGSATGTNIALTFSNIKLSAHTGNSIFKNATLLESFQHNDGEGSTASYNYTWNEDWGTGNRNVTYGREVSDTHKNESKQNKYYGDWQRDRYTSPDSGTQSSQYSFTGYLPYVAKTSVTGTTDLTYDEIDVNIERPYLNEGCGTYSDPYIVDGSKLQEVARIINGAPSKNWEVNYNKDVVNKNSDSSKYYTKYTDSSICNGGNNHKTYVYDGTAFKYKGIESNVEDVSKDAMLSYLCEAYYKINDDIILGSDFIGLGGSTVGTAFRGVIVGDSVKPPTITNNSGNPLIRNSNGSVVKDIQIKQDTKIDLSESKNSSFSYTTQTSEYYGAVFGIVHGGDNIIDNVKVTAYPTITFDNNGTYNNLIPVGGYIGVIINGGVYFRNMSGAQGITTAKLEGVGSNSSYLYRNPYIGRVLNGFAIEEGDSFNGSENLENSGKNYIITEVNKDSTQKIKGTGSKVEIPDAQSLFIFSLIGSSGAGYCRTKIYDSTCGYEDYYMIRNAEYSNVGKSGLTSIDTDYSKVIVNGHNGDLSIDGIDTKQGIKTPHIIMAYTQEVEFYELKWLCLHQNEITLTGTGDYDLSGTGFRGISAIYSQGNTNVVPIASFDGKSKAITEQIKIRCYDNDNYPVDSKNTYGVGFVNYLSSNNSSTIKDATFKGSVSFASISNDKEIYTYGSSVGGVVGRVINAANFTNITLDGLSVNGVKVSGGLIGTSVNAVTISGVKTTDNGITVTGDSQVGGLVGYSTGSLTIGSDGSTFDVIVNNISSARTQEKENTTDATMHSYGVGGIVGFAAGDLSIVGAQVKGKDTNSYIGTVSNGAKKATVSENVGGIVGSVGDNTAITSKIEQATVDIDLYGWLVGGIVGINYKSNMTLESCAYNGDENKININAITYAGGLIGKSNSDLSISDSVVKSADINALYDSTSSYYNNSHDVHVGGSVGVISGGNVTVKNLEISNAALSFNGNVWWSINLGGMIGSIGDSYNQGINGYNIMMNSVSYKSTGTQKTIQKANIIGYNPEKNKTIKKIKLVGVTQINNTEYLPDYYSTYGADSFTAIHTDYNGSCTADNKVTEFSQNANEASTVAANSPYVNVNPAKTYAGLDLTGDFAAENMGAIIAAAKTGSESSNKYQNTGVNARADNIDQTKLKTFSEVADQKIDATNNMPILLIDDNSSANITKMLSDYVSVLTNHETDLNTDLSDLLSVSTQSYTYSNNAWTAAGNKSLTYDESKHRFKTVNGVYDNDGSARFTLITLDYADPTTTNGNTALRIHIPVFVKKVLDFSFTSRVLTGTDYNHLDYTDKKFAFESFGSPITTYFTYTYYRTAQEWQDAINNGDDLLWNFDKKLELKGEGGGKASGFLPAETKLTLIDVNQSDKAYQKTANEVGFSDGVLDLSKFGDDLITLNGLLMNYATVIAKEDIANGTLVVTEDKTKATAMAMLGDKLTYFKLADDTDSDSTKYSVSVVNKYENNVDSEKRIMLSENYYLTIQTPAADDTAAKSLIKNFVGYYSKVNSKLDCPENKSLPTYELNSDKSTYIIANFLTQEVTVQAKNSAEINTANDLINVTMTSKITLNKDLANTFRNYVLGNDFKMHQGFNISLTKFENGENGTATQIVGGSTVEGEFSIGETKSPINGFTLTEAKDNWFLQYPKSIWDNLKDTGNNEVKITADVKITYSTSGMIEQFPERKDGDTKTGIAVNASSNIAYSEDSVEHSQVYKSVSTGSYYYRYAMSAADLSYDVVESTVIDVKDSPYSQLGVNPNDMSSEQMLITAKGHYDLTELTENIRSQGEQIKFTMTLYQKNVDDTYEQVGNIDNYLCDISMTYKNDVVVPSPNDNNSYTFIVSGYEGDETYDVTTKFNVITGEAFEGRKQLYANYKVQLTAELLDKKDDPIAGTTVSDYIIYTNARINTSFINAS